MLLNAINRVNVVSELLTVLIIFVFVLAITYATTRWIANYQKGRSLSNNIQVIETNKITATKYVQIIKVSNKYLVIAVCKDTVTLLTELAEEDINVLHNDKKVGLNFKEILEMAKKPAAKKGGLNNPDKNT